MFIPDLRSEFFHPGSWIQGKKKSLDTGSATNDWSICGRKTLLSYQKYDSRCFSRIPDFGFFFLPRSRIPDPKNTKSRIRIRNTARKHACSFFHAWNCFDTNKKIYLMNVTFFALNNPVPRNWNFWVINWNRRCESHRYSIGIRRH